MGAEATFETQLSSGTDPISASSNLVENLKNSFVEAAKSGSMFSSTPEGATLVPTTSLDQISSAFTSVVIVNDFTSKEASTESLTSVIGDSTETQSDTKYTSSELSSDSTHQTTISTIVSTGESLSKSVSLQYSEKTEISTVEFSDATDKTSMSTESV